MKHHTVGTLGRTSGHNQACMHVINWDDAVHSSVSHRCQLTRSHMFTNVSMTALISILGLLLCPYVSAVEASGTGWDFTSVKSKQEAIALASVSEHFRAFKPQIVVKSTQASASAGNAIVSTCTTFLSSCTSYIIFLCILHSASFIWHYIVCSLYPFLPFRRNLT